MPDFEFEFRSEPRDIRRGLIVDLEPDDHFDPEIILPAGHYPNRAVPSNPGKQTTGSKQPSLVTLGNAHFYNFDGADDFMLFEQDFTSAASDFTFAFAATPDVATGTLRYFFDGSGTAFPLVLAQLSNTANQLGYNDGSWQTDAAAVATTNLQGLVWQFDGTGGRVFRDGAQLFSDPYTPLSIDGSPNIVIGARNDGLANFYDGKLGNFLAWSRSLSTREQQLVSARVADRYGFPHSADQRATVEIVDWRDPAAGTKPSRTNPFSGIPHKRAKASLGWLQIVAVVNGVQGPLDSALGGRLFQCYVIEHPTAYQPPVLQDSGYSSVADVRLDAAGHYTIVFRRTGGGAFVIHVDAA